MVVALLHGLDAEAQAAASTGGGTQGGAARAAIAVGAGAGTALAPTPAAPAPGAGARYVESCQQAIERGIVNPGCQGPLYQSEIARLKEDALRTNNPSLLTMVGDAYQSNRTGVSDIGQAYRWYLLGAVRGDPRAMQRLSELYQQGRGAPQDNIKALGYARLAQRLAPPGSTSARQATEAINSLGGEMATEEMALAERFASDLENTIRNQAGLSSGAAAGVPAAPKTASTLARLPGMGAVQPEGAPEQPSAPPSPLPGRDSLPSLPRQP
ncbi:sel1 repeat family protein [Variovorax sp. DT-64]|uniref:sel1 repeat family protein n=1 Tax=Variovorax sp. DT-64 TaxID=3396160 RepID=UPI003F1A23C8